MHIEFVRTGGVTGMRLATHFDTQGMASEQAAALDKLIQDSGFFSLPQQILPASPAPDRFEYHLTVTTSSKETHSIVVSETTMPEPLQPLIRYLTTLALSGTANR